MPLAKKEKRLLELSHVMDKFKASIQARHDIEIEYVENAAEKIVNRYEIILDGIIKKYLPEDSRAEPFKVASGLEIATLLILPILQNDPLKRERLNAVLAASIGAQFTLQCLYDELEFRSLDSCLNEEVNAICINHMNWIMYSIGIDVYDFPIFSNAIFWRTFAALYRTQHTLTTPEI